MKLYVDTSVLAAYYLPEALSERAQQILMRVRRPVISALVGVEFASVLARRVRTRELSAGAARAVLTRFRSHEEAGLYRVSPVEGAHYARARRWIETLRTPLRTLDALHLAVAARLGCVVLTADVQLARAARSLRVRRRLLLPTDRRSGAK